MRVGISPARSQSIDWRPARVTVAVLVSIPELAGYHAQRLDVLRLCLASLRRHTEAPYDLLVFDNGSCREVGEYLTRLCHEGAIAQLLQSHRNVGKVNALRMLFGAAPGEIVAYSDDDIYYLPGWLPAHLQLFEAFPRVGMVSGWAIRHTFGYANAAASALPESDRSTTVERGRFLPDAWEEDFAASTGRSAREHLEATAALDDVLLRRGGVSAFATAGHFQFVAPREVFLRAAEREWSTRLMGELREIETRVDAAGYLRLSTRERYVRHIGNLLTPKWDAEAKRLEEDGAAERRDPRPPLLARRLASQRHVQRVVRRAYHLSFWLLSDAWRTAPVVAPRQPSTGVEACPLCHDPRRRQFDRRVHAGIEVANWVCCRCSFVYMSPRPSDEELGEFYRRAYRELYDREDRGQETTEMKRAHHLAAFAAAHGIRASSHLDIGSARGELLRAVAAALPIERSVGIEPDEACRAPRPGDRHHVLASMDLLDPSDTTRFELISLSHVLEHLSDPVGELRRIRERYLAPAGHLLVEVPNVHAHECFEVAHLGSFSETTLVAALRAGGFQMTALKKHAVPTSSRRPLYLTALARPAAPVAVRRRPLASSTTAWQRRAGLAGGWARYVRTAVARAAAVSGFRS